MRAYRTTMRCQECGRDFPMALHRITSGRTKFCSKECLRVSRSIERRLTSKLVMMPSGCLEYVGYRTRLGYGQIMKTAEKSALFAHRVAWEVTNGPIPDGLNVCHRCDNPPCCRLEHLFLGTRAENRADCVAKGRQARGDRMGCVTHPERVARGSRNAAAKLTEVFVREIRAVYTGRRGQIVELADKYGVNHQAIRAVVQNKAWTHVE